MAKPKIKHTITKKEWNKKHKDFKLMGKDGIPYIMMYDSKIGTHLVPVKIIDESVDEASRADIHKAAKKGSYPITIVISAKGSKGVGAVRHQQLVDTPMEVPAVLNILKKKYSTSGHHFSIEDKTGKVLYNESVNEAYIVTYTKKKGEKPASAAFQLRGSALSFEKDLKKDGYITMVTQKKVKGIDESVNESKEEVTPQQLSKIQSDIRKINSKIKVYISKHPMTKGELSIELGAGHDDDSEIQKIYKVLKKHTGDWRTGTMFNESVNEATSEKNFKLGTPAVFDGDRGEVVTNPKTQRAWTPNGWGNVSKGVKGIMIYGSNTFIVPDWSKTKKFNESVNEAKRGEFEVGDFVHFKSANKSGLVRGIKGDKVTILTMKGSYTGDIKDVMLLHQDGVNEMDMNDPILVKLRALQMKKNKDAAKKIDTEKQNKNANKIKALKKKRAEVMRDMEQEAEPEGGKIADRYGKLLNRIDNDIIKLGGNPMSESINEADDVYHKSYTHAIEAAEVYAKKKGYEIEDDEMFTKVGMNSKRPSVGKTTRVSLELLKNGKPQRKMLHIQVYGMKNGYELNAYIN